MWSVCIQGSKMISYKQKCSQWLIQIESGGAFVSGAVKKIHELCQIFCFFSFPFLKICIFPKCCVYTFFFFLCVVCCCLCVSAFNTLITQCHSLKFEINGPFHYILIFLACLSLCDILVVYTLVLWVACYALEKGVIFPIRR